MIFTFSFITPEQSWACENQTYRCLTKDSLKYFLIWDPNDHLEFSSDQVRPEKGINPWPVVDEMGASRSMIGSSM